MSAPATVAVPVVGAMKQVRIFIVVDLPAPFGPRKPRISPRRSSKLASFSATKLPYSFPRPEASIITSVIRDLS